jgi:Flp pilus assembly protein TadD
MSETAADWSSKAFLLWNGAKFTDPKKAIEYLNNAIKLQPDDAIAYNQRGIAYKNIGQYQRAIEDYNEAIHLKSDLAEAYYNRGTAYFYLSKYNKAREDFNEAVRLKPDDPHAYYNYACLFALKKDATQACKWLQLAIERGLNDWKHIKEDKDFDNIRKTECFINLLKELEK